MACAKAKAIENMISKNLIKKTKNGRKQVEIWRIWIHGWIKSKKARLDIKLLRLS